MSANWLVKIFVSSWPGEGAINPSKRDRFLGYLDRLPIKPISVEWEVRREIPDRSSSVPGSMRKVFHTSILYRISAQNQFDALTQARILWEKLFSEEVAKEIRMQLADLTAEEANETD